LDCENSFFCSIWGSRVERGGAVGVAEHARVDGAVERIECSGSQGFIVIVTVSFIGGCAEVGNGRISCASILTTVGGRGSHTSTPHDSTSDTNLAFDSIELVANGADSGFVVAGISTYADGSPCCNQLVWVDRVFRALTEGKEQEL
jgi:hypothetical protein